MTKLTLLAAASVAAIITAGAAQAGQITGAVGTTTPRAATASLPFLIASERTDGTTSTETAGFVATNQYASAVSVTAGTTQNYRVVFTVTNGAIAASNIALANGVNPVTAGVTIAPAGTTANSATFIVTVDNSAGMTAIVFDRVALITTLTSPTELDVSVASTTELLAGGVATVLDTTAATTLVKYSPLISGFSVSARTAVAALGDYKSFTATGSTAPLVSSTQAIVAENYAVGQGTGNFYGSLAGAAPVQISVGTVVSGGTVVVTGTANQLNTLVPDLGAYTAPTTFTSLGIAPTRTANTATFVLPNTEADTFGAGTIDLSIAQPGTPVAASADSFTTTFAPTFITGYTAPSTPYSAASGSITLAGTNYLVPWVGGSQAPGQTVIRLTNSTGTAITGVQIRLNNAQARAPGVTSGPGTPIANAMCTNTTFSIPANGELQLTGTTLNTCFGAFLRGDVQITVQSDSSNLTAKARNVDASGVVGFEQTLGRAGF